MTGRAIPYGLGVLVLLAPPIALFDQATKFLAVKHLTPGLERARAAAGIERPGLLDELALHYGAIDHPCDQGGCRPIRVVGGFFDLRYVENPGAAWGLLASARESVRAPFFFLVSLAAMGFILVVLAKTARGERLVAFGLASIFGGALGNFVDRLHLAYVIDFIDWYVGDVHWPTFNVADAAISTGVGLLVLDWLLAARRARVQPPSPAS